MWATYTFVSYGTGFSLTTHQIIASLYRFLSERHYPIFYILGNCFAYILLLKYLEKRDRRSIFGLISDYCSKKRIELPFDSVRFTLLFQFSCPNYRKICFHLMNVNNDRSQ